MKHSVSLDAHPCAYQIASKSIEQFKLEALIWYRQTDDRQTTLWRMCRNSRNHFCCKSDSTYYHASQKNCISVIFWITAWNNGQF